MTSSIDHRVVLTKKTKVKNSIIDHHRHRNHRYYWILPTIFVIIVCFSIFVFLCHFVLTVSLNQQYPSSSLLDFTLQKNDETKNNSIHHDVLSTSTMNRNNFIRKNIIIDTNDYDKIRGRDNIEDNSKKKKLESNNNPPRTQTNLSSIQQAIVNALLPHERILFESSRHQLNDNNDTQQQQQQQHQQHRPPLNSLIDPNNETIITGDVQFLLDFAIIGFGKCGTSSMMYWLGQHTSEIHMFQQEISELLHSRPTNLIKLLYTHLIPNKKHGYKSPSEITGGYQVLNYFRHYFPKTKLIIGIRHPIHYFESLYNFRIQQNYNNKNHTNIINMPKPQQLIGICNKGKYNTCTEKANFAYHLIQLGKHCISNHTDNNNSTDTTPSTLPASCNNQTTYSLLEKRIMNRYLSTDTHNKANNRIHPIPNPIFLFDLAQLNDTNKTRIDLFRQDVQEFLGLEQSLPPSIQHYRPGIVYNNESIQKTINQWKINICDDQYINVRRELLLLGQDSSMWIRNVFVNSPDVHISSRNYFIDLLELWMKDPCGNTSMTQTVTYRGPRINKM